MLNAVYRYFRSMDYIKIVCIDVLEARLALKRLSLANCHEFDVPDSILLH